GVLNERFSTWPFVADPDDDYGVTYAYYDERSSIAGSISGTFAFRETVTQASTGATALLESQDTGLIRVVAITGTPDASNVWTGGSSGATITPSGAPVALGNDGTGAASASAATAKASPFATDQAANIAIRNFNNANYGRNTTDAGVLRMLGRLGRSPSISSPYPTTANVAVTWEPDETFDDHHAVIYNRQGGNGLRTANVLVRRFRFSCAGATAMLSSGAPSDSSPPALWMERCLIEDDSAADTALRWTGFDLAAFRDCEAETVYHAFDKHSTHDVVFVRNC